MGVKWSPPLKTRFWEVPPNIGSQIFRFCPKVRFPPLRMAQRGENPHFEPPTRDVGSDMGGFLKIWPKRGVPLFWALFGDFGDFRGIQVNRENGTPTFGGHLRGPPEGRFGPWTHREGKIDPREDL